MVLATVPLHEGANAINIGMAAFSQGWLFDSAINRITGGTVTKDSEHA